MEPMVFVFGGSLSGSPGGVLNTLERRPLSKRRLETAESKTAAAQVA